VHTRTIAAHETPPEGEAHGGAPTDEQVTGSLERVSAADEVHGSRVEEVRDVAFPVALRGYEREAVDAYVEHVSRLVAELEATGSPEGAVRRALDQVGEETSSILQRAQETASEVTARSRAQADDRLREAEREAAEITADAEERVRELDADFARLWDGRDRLLDEVRELAERLLAVADDAAERWAPQREDDIDPVHSGDTAAIPPTPADDAAGAEPMPDHGPERPPGDEPDGDSPDFTEVYDHEDDVEAAEAGGAPAEPTTHGESPEDAADHPGATGPSEARPPRSATREGPSTAPPASEPSAPGEPPGTP